MFDLVWLIKTGGYLGVSLIIFAESGVLLGLFFPGDSLLFTAGFLASQSYFDIKLMLPLVFISAVLGDNAGYAFGNKVGYKIFNKEDSLFFKQSYLQKAKIYFESHGGKTLIIARFIPGVRTFAPILAGVGKMNYKIFMVYNLIGAFIWAVGLTLIGYFLGNLIPDVDAYILPIIGFIVLVSLTPVFWKLVKDPEIRSKLMSFFRKKYG